MTHNPSRFEVYHELEDGSGFAIPNCDHVFKFEEMGGWFDEEHNYYNADGEPETPPSSRKCSQHSSYHNPKSKYTDDDLSDDDYDDYQDIVNQYKYDNGSEDEEVVYNDEELRNMQKIENNLETLSGYPLNKALRVFYKNMDYFHTPEVILSAYSKSIGEISKVVPNMGSDNRRKSDGHFVLPNKEQAGKLVQLEGKSILSRPVYFKVENIQELIIDPIGNIWRTEIQQKQHQEPKPKQTEKEKQKAPIQVCKQQSKTQGQAGPKETQQKPALCSTQQSKQSFMTYKFPIPLFEGAPEFKEWMKGLGLQNDNDYRNLRKKTINDTQQVYGLIDMAESALKKCDGQKFKGKEVSFTGI